MRQCGLCIVFRAHAAAASIAPVSCGVQVIHKQSAQGQSQWPYLWVWLHAQEWMIIPLNDWHHLQRSKD